MAPASAQRLNRARHGILIRRRADGGVTRVSGDLCRSRLAFLSEAAHTSALAWEFSLVKSSRLGKIGIALLCAWAAPSLAAEHPPTQITVRKLKPDLRNRIRVVVQLRNLGAEPISHLTVACTVSKDEKVLGSGKEALHNLASGRTETVEVLVPAGTLQSGLSAACRVTR